MTSDPARPGSLTGMDNAAAQPKVRLKVPFSGITFKIDPFAERHLVALTLSKRMPTTKRLDIMMKILEDVLGEDQYDTVTESILTGASETSALTNLLEDIIKATRAYEDSKKGLDEFDAAEGA